MLLVGSDRVAIVDPADPDELAVVAEAVAREAAELLLDGLRDPTSVRGEGVDNKTSRTDHVTAWDRAAESLVIERLADLRPGDAVLGEEGGARPGDSAVRWIVDPLDGTTNFLYGLPPFAVSIAAERDGRVVAGAVADALHGELYVAALGAGARRNGIPLRPSDCDEVSQALVATGFGYQASQRRRQAEVLVRVLPHIRDIRRAGAASVDLCWVASGRVDAYWEVNLGLWDFSAGALVASEAGAVVTDLGGGPPAPESVLAAAPGVYEGLRELLESAGAALG